VGLIKHPQGKYARPLLGILSAWPPAVFAGKTQKIRIIMSTITTISAAKTMSSVDLVEVINGMREDGAAELLHKNFIVKIESHPGIDAAKFLASQKYGNNNTRKIYNLPEREARLMVMSESLEVQTAVLDRLIKVESVGPIDATITATKLFEALFGVCQLIGLDKNVSAISANQGANTLTGANLLQLVGQTHLINPKQAQYFTPTELGKSCGISGQKMNSLMASSGLQAKHGALWIATGDGVAMSRIYDTGKTHGLGVPIQQVKWTEEAIKFLGLVVI
jgi:hypothetical protein